MNFLLLLPHYITPDDLGGIRSWQIGTYLAKQGHTVTAVVPGVDPRTGLWHHNLRGRAFSVENIDGVKLIRTAVFPENRQVLARRVLYYASQSVMGFLAGLRIGHPDAVMATSAPTTTMLFAWLLARLKKAAFVVDVRDLTVDAALELGYVKPTAAVRAVLSVERMLFNRADKIITVSPGWRDQLFSKGIDCAKIELVPIGFEPAVLGAVDWELDVCKVYDLGEDFVVFYAGMLGYIPDIMTILRAAERVRDLADVKFLFVGTGQREDEYRSYCSQHELNNCRFLGAMPRKRIPPLCRVASLCVNALPKGSFWGSIVGSKTFEYMGMGRPLLYAGDGAGTAEIIRKSKGGIVVPAGDSGGMASAIRKLHSERAVLEEMGENARRYTLQHFSSSSLMPMIEKTLADAVKLRRSRARR